MTKAGEDYWRLWLRLDRMPAGLADGPEGEALKDEMDAPWFAMTTRDDDEFRGRAGRHNFLMGRTTVYVA